MRSASVSSRGAKLSHGWLRTELRGPVVRSTSRRLGVSIRWLNPTRDCDAVNHITVLPGQRVGMSAPENGLGSSNAGRGGGEDAASLGFENFGRKGLRPRGKRPRTFCFQSGCAAEAWTVQTRWADNFDAQQPCQGQRDALAALNWSAGYSGQSAAHRKQMHQVVHELVKEQEKPAVFWKWRRKPFAFFTEIALDTRTSRPSSQRRSPCPTILSGHRSKRTCCRLTPVPGLRVIMRDAETWAGLAGTLWPQCSQSALHGRDPAAKTWGAPVLDTKASGTIDSTAGARYFAFCAQ